MYAIVYYKEPKEIATKQTQFCFMIFLQIEQNCF